MKRLFAALLAAANLATPALAGGVPDAMTRVERAGFTGRVLIAGPSQTVVQYRFGPSGAAPVWPWGSVSKQVVAALVMAQVDQGAFSLDDTVAARLPLFPNPDAAKATLRQLLQHTAGLANPEDSPGFYERPGAKVGGPSDAMGVCAGPAKRAPGEAFDYNNCDTIVLGAILERTSGLSFARLLKQRIATPLGLTSLHMAAPGERPVTARSGGKPTAPINLATFGPSGAMVGTPEDLVRFDQALLAGALMTPASRAVMWAGDPKLGYVALGAWAFSTRLAGCAAPVMLIERRGSVDGVQTRNIIAPESGKILVAFTDDADFEFGEIWQGRGASYDLASAAFCE